MQPSAWTFKTYRRALAAPLLGAAALCLTALLLCFALLCLTLKPDLTLYQERSRLLYDSSGQIAAYSLSADGRLRFLSPPDTVDPLLIKLILAAEDERFYEHPGVDFIALG
ncbi:MAG: transglycosylase domain-containing protein, partial [Proteobacteria bacterium]|nr:transglycosylase domain-containing protein [Candidatus Avisuccinivibrio stercorigallinarum]